VEQKSESFEVLKERARLGLKVLIMECNQAAGLFPKWMSKQVESVEQYIHALEKKLNIKADK
jgi:hypothetical protein